MENSAHAALGEIRDRIATILEKLDPSDDELKSFYEQQLPRLHDLALEGLRSPATNLVKKMVAIMKGVRRIPKRAAVSQDEGNYAAVTAADVFDSVRELMAEHGVLLIGRPRETAVDNAEVVVTFDFEWTDGEDSLLVSDIKVRVLEQRTKSDKAIQTAYTIAHKLVVMNQFLISTGTAEPEAVEDSSPQMEPGINIVAGKLVSVKTEGPADDRYWQVVVNGISLVCKDELLAREIEGIKLGSEVVFRTLKKPKAKFARLIGFHQEAAHA